jgi:tRNA threonylcarbamoyladenosine biosynthesis protein TsaB
VGIATAKAFAYAASAAVIGVDSMEILALQAAPAAERFWVAIDAQRGDAVVRPFRVDSPQHVRPERDAVLTDLRSWLDGLPDGSRLTGPVFRKRSAAVPDRLELLPEALWRASANTVAQHACRAWAEGHADELWTLTPRYSRRSAAEEKWDAKEQSAE